MNKQQIFDKVAGHLLKQKIRCEYMGEPVYSTKNFACSIGCLLSNKLQKKIRANNFIGNLYQLMKKYKCPEYFKEHYYFLKWLQYLHDDPYTWKTDLDGNFQLPIRLKEFAEKERLQWNF